MFEIRPQLQTWLDRVSWRSRSADLIGSGHDATMTFGARVLRCFGSSPRGC